MRGEPDALLRWSPGPDCRGIGGWVARWSSSAQVSEDGEDAAVVCVGGWEVEFDEDVADVFLDGAGADVEGLDDAVVGASFGHEPQYLGFARGQAVEGVGVVADEELGDDFGIECGAASGDAAEGVEEVTDAGDA